MPAFLLPDGPEELAPGDVLDGLKLTGHFLETAVFAPHNRPLPGPRERLVERISRTDNSADDTIQT